MAAQIALSFTLLAGCGLFLRTLQNLQHVDLGYSRDLMMRFTVRPGLNGYSDEQLVAYYQKLQAQLTAAPGVQSVAFSMHAPVDGGTAITVGKVPGYTQEGKRIQIYRHDVSAGYFETLSIPILLGRGIEAQDNRQAAHVAVVNQAFIKQYLHGDNPLGHRIDLGSAKDPQPYEIVGVARDVKYADLRADIPPTAYFSFLQRKTAPPFMTFEVRGRLPEAQLLPLLQHTVLSLDARVPAVEVKTETDAIGEVLSLERTFATLSSAFGLLAVALAAIGLYGTVSYAVAMRTNEIGIRMALGADRGAVTRMVLRDVLSIVLIGVVTGIPAVWLMSKLLRSQLFGLSPHDGVSLSLAVILILSISFVAGSVPARRAARVEPVEALRYE